MSDTEFYAALRQYLASRKITSSVLDKAGKKRVTRVADNYVLKDNRLFYTGPSRQYMRLVVLSDEQKRAVLEECHKHPGTGNHSGVRGTRDRVVAGYYWSSLKKDVTDWVKCCHRCQLKNPIKTVAPVLHPIKVLSNIKRAQKKSCSERKQKRNIVGDCLVSSSVDTQMHQPSGSCRLFAHGESTLKEEQLEVACDRGRAGLHGDATESYAEDEREAEEGSAEAKTHALTDSACSSASFSFTDRTGQDGVGDWPALEEGCVLVRRVGERPAEQDETSVHTLTSSPIASDVTELGLVHIIEDHCSGTSIKLELSDESEDVGDATGIGNDSLTACGPTVPPVRKEDPALEYRSQIAGDSTETPAHTDCGRRTHTEETPTGHGGPSDFELLRAQLLRGKSTASLRGPNVCEVCGRSFSLQETLQLHQLLHRLDDTYSCAVCGRRLEAGCPCGRGQCQCSDCEEKPSRSKSPTTHQRAYKARAVCVDT
ncbi:uncharacterized protein LOC118783424 [Megalops cyprinoides]|uniref:uncharacterized protein LOC118783424 n=1 Tax=Megalops cyprinoides TaxID=118141 RepID=UPI0018650A96|nr:uncharacterized protein LOC118783424 [Megalops cyprinoides]